MCHKGNSPTGSEVCKVGSVVTVSHVQVPITARYYFPSLVRPYPDEKIRGKILRFGLGILVKSCGEVFSIYTQGKARCVVLPGSS